MIGFVDDNSTKTPKHADNLNFISSQCAPAIGQAFNSTESIYIFNAFVFYSAVV